ncbi:MAG: histidine phosphatase family protein [Bacillota bacterium]|nr:histidine phosphatase family protein [Bacillota bacterium]
MTRLYFVRHGESEGNFEKRFLGQLDRDLTPKGRRQAELTAEYFRDAGINAIYSSDLKRAVNSAEKIGKATELKVIERRELREIYAGLWQEKTFDELAKDAAYDVWLNDIGNAKCPGGETVKKLQERIAQETDRILKKHQGENVVIVTHATPIRIMKCLWLGIPLSMAHTVKWVPNCSITVVDYNDSGECFVALDGYDKQLGELSTSFGANV